MGECGIPAVESNDQANKRIFSADVGEISRMFLLRSSRTFKKLLRVIVQ